MMPTYPACQVAKRACHATCSTPLVRTRRSIGVIRVNELHLVGVPFKIAFTAQPFETELGGARHSGRLTDPRVHVHKNDRFSTLYLCAEPAVRPSVAPPGSTSLGTRHRKAQRPLFSDWAPALVIARGRNIGEAHPHSRTCRTLNGAGDDLLQSHRAIDDVMKRPEQLPPAPPRPGVRAADWRGSVSRLKTEGSEAQSGPPRRTIKGEELPPRPLAFRPLSLALTSPASSH